MAQTLSHLCTATRAEAMLDHRTRMRSLQRDRWIDYPVPRRRVSDWSAC